MSRSPGLQGRRGRLDVAVGAPLSRKYGASRFLVGFSGGCSRTAMEYTPPSDDPQDLPRGFRQHGP